MNIITFDLSTFANSAQIDTPDILIETLREHIKLNGQVIYDERLSRFITELAPMSLIFDRDIIFYLQHEILSIKWVDNINEFVNQFNARIWPLFDKKEMRRLIYFDTDFGDKTFSCISTLHFLLTAKGWHVNIYQRASDLMKFKDDLKFICEILNIVEKFLEIKFQKIIIHYGTIHFANE